MHICIFLHTYTYMEAFLTSDCPSHFKNSDVSRHRVILLIITFFYSRSRQRQRKYVVPTTMIAPRDDINTVVKCVANTTKNLISLLYDDEDDDLLLSEQGLTHKVKRPLPTERVTMTTASTPVCNNRAASTPSERTAKKRKLVLQKSYAVISICTRGNADGDACRNWRRKELKIVGVYTSKEAAESARRGVMESHCKRGYGDIIAKGCLDDEIDLIIREDTRFTIGLRYA
jgi:hypothetical protein